MAGPGDLDDDYVAKLLAEDAKKTSQKYLSQGLSAFLPKRRAADALKPNTRFLSHIVREADSHNAALKRREEVEARKRLRELQGKDERPRKRPRADETTDSKRNRLLKDIVSAANSGNVVKHQHREASWRKELGPEDGKRTERRRHTHTDRDSEYRLSRSPRGRQSSSREPDYDSHPTKPRSHSHTRRKERRRSETRERPGVTVRDLAPGFIDGTSEQRYEKSEEPVRKRGRGAHKETSGIDERFQKEYDPSHDILLDSEGEDDADDWDMALEAMRDRIKWKSNQASRMREAGFEEKDIVKWEKSALPEDDWQRDRNDVKWSRRGEVREWDAGKT